MKNGNIPTQNMEAAGICYTGVAAIFGGLNDDQVIIVAASKPALERVLAGFGLQADYDPKKSIKAAVFKRQ